VKDEARDAIIMRICNRLPRNYVHVEETLAEAGFFDLLEAAELALGALHPGAMYAGLRDAIHRAKEGK
jgi:hypothetical protein